MRKRLIILQVLIISFCLNCIAKDYIRVNQLGYPLNAIKVAVMLSDKNEKPVSFKIIDFFTGKEVFESKIIKECGAYGKFSGTFRLDFTKFTGKGTYYLIAGEGKSPVFRLSDDVYNHSADFLLNYMRQQRCGYNPVLKDSCHTHGGFIVYQPNKEGQHINIFGGWHDASDYLQYVTTSANATYQLLFAYKQNPAAFGDFYKGNGTPGANGIPDILDEARWGLEWLMKMNPEDSVMYNQVADDRDHAGFRPPTKDNADYGKGKERPVYFCTGQPQGLLKNKNRATGIASTAGKYASSFALASDIFKSIDPKLSAMLLHKAKADYEYGLAHPGACQTAPCKSPYFYEEDNWVDDMELAAAQLYQVTGDKRYLRSAVNFGKQEPFTPWMGADTARHYQWYPFVNLGHFWLAKDKKQETSKEFILNLKEGIDRVAKRGNSNPFLYGVPNIWCSNNLVAAILTQCRLYHSLTGDKTYLEVEAAYRDWLLGCNPWGKCMIVGMPEWGDYPNYPHSAISKELGIRIDGGLVDGPVYNSIFSNLKGLVLLRPDKYADFQSDKVVYHDDLGDYSTNEPTMDGTASLTYYFSSMQNIKSQISAHITDQGAVCRINPNRKTIYLTFSGHEYADGGDVICKVLKNNNAKANFFFTGDFYRNPKFRTLIQRLKTDGHYLGPHSDKHLLYADWSKRDSLLVDFDKFSEDLQNNYQAMKDVGINPANARVFLPPFEWHNMAVSKWCEGLGIHLVNFTPGTYSNADYTLPGNNNYRSSDFIEQKIKSVETTDEHGLNGFILLMHIGTAADRTDKFYSHLDEIVKYLKGKGYHFETLDTQF
ncbi:MAG: glycoside hydrolase family 9 protein [Bacteroidota bacterium]|nr:glycoside hydrolase family 9 protein [Bacteroidota bacterium]